jgi:hypothetical protein
MKNQQSIQNPRFSSVPGEELGVTVEVLLEQDLPSCDLIMESRQFPTRSETQQVLVGITNLLGARRAPFPFSRACTLRRCIPCEARGEIGKAGDGVKHGPDKRAWQHVQ